MARRNRTAKIAVILVTAAITIFLISLKYLISNTFYTAPDIFTMIELTPEVRSVSEFQNIINRATRGKGLPDESRNIFACNDHNRDPAYWLVFELPKDNIPSFVKKITGTELEKLTDGIFSKYHHINKGPHNWRDGLLGAPYWDLNAVENGRRFEDVYFYFGVDIKRSKVFLCHWTS